MRTPIILGLMAAVAIPSIAQAQTSRGELHHDNREVARSREAVRDARLHGDRGDVRDARRELREDQKERREDWQDYRKTNRQAYRQSAYVGPRGYAYRPVAVGYRFQQPYYSGRYVISDPHRYRLPMAHGYQRWVRYGNDVVLVDVRSGRVLEVHNSFFW